MSASHLEFKKLDLERILTEYSGHYSNKYECLLNQVYTLEAPLPHLRYLPAMEAVSCYTGSLFPESDVPVLPVASSEKSLLEDDV